MKTNKGQSNFELSKKLEIIVAFLQQPEAKRTFADAMRAAFYLWENYDVDVKEIVIKVLQKVETMPNGRNRLKEEISKTPQRRRLLHDPRLKDIAPEISPPRHRWPVLIEPFFFSKQDNPQQKNWLDVWELLDNPFGNPNPLADPFTMKTIVTPCCWDEYKSMEPRIFSSSEFQDRQVVIQKICKEVSDSLDDDTFVMKITLPFAELTTESTRYDYLASLAKVVGKYWFEYLTDLYEDDNGVIICPTDFLDLEKEKQDELAAFLSWMFGSNEQLLILLKERGLREYKNGRKLLEVIERILKNKTDLPGLVPEKQLLSWFQLRPPGRSWIVLLLNFPEQDDKQKAEEQAWNLMQLANLLMENKVVLKLFSNDKFLPSKPNDKLSLCWGTGDLQSMLSSRLQNVSNGIMSIDEFFGPMDVNCEERFLQEAKGSLAVLLRLCNKLLNFHCEMSQDYMYFLEDEIDAILRVGE